MSADHPTAAENPLPIAVSDESTLSSTVHAGLDIANDRPLGIESKQPQDITVRLQYLENNPLYEHTKPIQVTPPFPRSSKTNVRLSPGPGEILHDVRGRESEFTLDGNGFCYLRAPTTFDKWCSQPAIAKEFLPEMEALLKGEVEGCDEVIFYDARLRQASDQGVRVQGMSYNPYARQVHVDNTETSVIEKIRSITDIKAEYHLNSRFRIINIWRPIRHPVWDCGLAISDGCKLRDGDVIECDRHRQDTGEYWDTMGVIRYRPGFEWYYMSRQDEPDVLLFKGYDSATDVKARLCLHTAFDVPPEEVPPNAPTRESIEIRALVFTRPKGIGKPPRTSIPHPLAVTLEQNKLKLIDEEHSITDRFRDDIDEGKEVKDAVLLLRRAQVHRLEHVCEALLAERDNLQADVKKLQWELESARQQFSQQNAHTEMLQQKISGLDGKLSCSNHELHRRIQDLSKELVDQRLCNGRGPDSQAAAVHSESSENAALLRHIEAQQWEIEKWKQQAMERGNQLVSLNWQASVDEAVQREREKDSFLIKSLQREIERLSSK